MIFDLINGLGNSPVLVNAQEIVGFLLIISVVCLRNLSLQYDPELSGPINAQFSKAALLVKGAVGLDLLYSATALGRVHPVALLLASAVTVSLWSRSLFLARTRRTVTRA